VLWDFSTRRGVFIMVAFSVIIAGLAIAFVIWLGPDGGAFV
jgi:hypothetical protein